MIVTAALLWFDEPVDMLAEAVRSVGGFADRIVAVDGGYARYPGGTASSPPEQADAIRTAAREAGLDCRVVVPDRVWAGQIEKRSAMYAIAIEGSDWLMSLSADDLAVGDPASVREQLAATGYDAMDVAFYTPPGTAQASTLWAENLIGSTERIAYFFRALPGFRCEDRHWHYSAMKGEQRVWLYGPPGGRYPVAEHGAIDGDFQIVHRTMSRQPKQILANRAFCNDRVMVVEMTGQEDDQPDLPRPVWDYESRLV